MDGIIVNVKEFAFVIAMVGGFRIDVALNPVRIKYMATLTLSKKPRKLESQRELFKACVECGGRGVVQVRGPYTNARRRSPQAVPCMKCDGSGMANRHDTIESR